MVLWVFFCRGVAAANCTRHGESMQRTTDANIGRAKYGANWCARQPKRAGKPKHGFEGKFCAKRGQRTAGACKQARKAKRGQQPKRTSKPGGVLKRKFCFGRKVLRGSFKRFNY